MRDVLVRPHDNHAAFVSINAPHVENIMAALKVRTEYFFVVAKPITALRRQEETGHGPDLELAMTLLENGSDIEHRIDIRACRRVSPDGRLMGRGEKLA